MGTLRTLSALAALVASAGCAASPSAEDGERLYQIHCSTCHGINLEGQPDWMTRGPDGRLPAPPHDASGHTWHHSDSQLLAIVRDGLATIAPGYETDMPAFAGVLSDGQIAAVLEYIRSRWPHREQSYQHERSIQDR